MDFDGFWDRNHRFSFLVARENARRILADPEVIAFGRTHLQRFAAEDPHQVQGYAMWMKLLALPAPDIAARLTERSERGDFTRATAPSFGPLAPAVRAKLIHLARSPLAETELS